MSLRFAALASGSKGNCLVAEAGRGSAATRILLDCGLAPREARRRLERCGLAPGQVDAVLLTHEHGDHAGHAFSFARRHRLPVWLTAGTLRGLLEEGGSAEGVMLRVFDPRAPFSIGDLQVFPFAVPHDAREPVQFVFSDGAARLGVLTDLGASAAHVEAVLSGLDALVLECNHDPALLRGGAYPPWLKARIAGPFGHLSNEAAGRLLGALERSRLQHVVAAHLSQQNNRPELARAALAGALGCKPDWIGVATQETGCAWRTLG